MKIFNVILLLLLLPLQAAFVSADDDNKGTLRLIELYTSHGCSSCPPADKLIGELLHEDDQLLALEFHVDYWNSLVHGKDGSFTDPFSDADYSERQRAYNAAALAGRPGVYTPQAIVNGRIAIVGSNRKHLAKALSRPADTVFDVRITRSNVAGGLMVEVTGADKQRETLAGTNIALARYLDKTETVVTGGENAGKTLVNHHVVTAFTTLGEVSVAGEMIFDIDEPAAGEGCVVLIQEDALTPIYAAATCP